MSTHQWRTLKWLPWRVCSCCGLVYLRNDATERAVRTGCAS